MPDDAQPVETALMLQSPGKRTSVLCVVTNGESMMFKMTREQEAALLESCFHAWLRRKAV